MPEFNITIADSPFATALDHYYSFLKNLIGPTQSQNVCLTNTLLTFANLPNAPLFAEGVFRSFADRTFEPSPMTLSPAHLGSGAVADRYSRVFEQMLDQVVGSIQLNDITPAQLQQVQRHEDRLDKLELDLQTLYVSMDAYWQNYIKQNNIKPDDADYEVRRLAYFNSFNFATRIGHYSERIRREYSAIRRIHESEFPDQEARMLAQFYYNISSNERKLTVPLTPRLERDHGYDDLQLANAAVYGNVAGFESGADIRPLGDLSLLLTQEGTRGFTVQQNQNAEHDHDKSWSVSGSSRKFFFIKVTASLDVTEKMRNTMSHMESIAINFKNISEYWVRRGDWFTATLSDYPRVLKFLEQNADTAKRLGHVIVSVIIGRGMSVEYKYDDASYLENWKTVDAKGAVTFGNFVGASAQYSENTRDKFIDTEKRTVTFSDGDDQCRVLGFRVEKILPDFDASRVAPTDLFTADFERVLKGQINYQDFEREFRKPMKK
jgi:hypothetical protein